METERQIALEQQSALEGIQQDVLTTRDIMQDINVLLEQQGEDLDTMEANVTKAADSVERGVKESRRPIVTKVREEMLPPRGLLVILTIILVPVLVTQLNNTVRMSIIKPCTVFEVLSLCVMCDLFTISIYPVDWDCMCADPYLEGHF